MTKRSDLSQYRKGYFDKVTNFLYHFPKVVVRHEYVRFRQKGDE